MAMNKVNIPAIILTITLLVVTSAIAQKLPAIQQASIRAPSNIKVDGKPTEWNNQFQAYNKATEVFYTLSNDNDKLYLTVQAIDPDVVEKIIEGGITLTINGTGKMKDQDGIAITYPVLDKNSFPETGPAMNIDKPESWTADSFMISLNKDFIARATDVRVTGVKEISSTILSIYNPEGIKVAALFDNKTSLTYELTVPLKYLGLSLNEPKSIVYNIKLSGMNYDGTFKSFMQGFRHQRTKVFQELRRGAIPYGNNGNPTVEGPNVPIIIQMISPTDFWGEYILAKK